MISNEKQVFMIFFVQYKAIKIYSSNLFKAYTNEL